jgi:hypothetical protein
MDEVKSLLWYGEEKRDKLQLTKDTTHFRLGNVYRMMDSLDNSSLNRKVGGFVWDRILLWQQAWTAAL